MVGLVDGNEEVQSNGVSSESNSSTLLISVILQGVYLV